MVRLRHPSSVHRPASYRDPPVRRSPLERQVKTAEGISKAKAFVKVVKTPEGKKLHQEHYDALQVRK